MNDYVLLSGTSNVPLAQKISEELRQPLGDIEITRFMDNECRVYVKEPVEGKNVVVIQSLSQIADQHLVELCLIGQALKSLKAKDTVAVIPWLGYSKQDKEFRKGESVSAQLVAKFIEAAGFDRIISLELHSENLIPYFRIPVTELSTRKLLSHALKGAVGLKVVSPDKGGQGRSERFARDLGLPIVYLTKIRDVVTGKVVITDISEDVSGDPLIIFDDIINTGSTAIRAGEFLKKHGAADITFLATHAVLAGDAAEKLSKSPIDRIVVTDTIDGSNTDKNKKIQVVSVAPLIAASIASLEG